MKISLNWLKEYIDLDHEVTLLADILTEIGLEVEGIETVEQIKGGLNGVVVGEVKSCAKHPNADRLSLTTVDVGESDPLQIVCGAPNVATGQKVLVAPVGTTLYGSDGAPWTIKKGKIRGEISQGMICAADELGLGDDHSGIMILDESTPTGLKASDHFDISNDIVFEIGLTPNRSDATCHIGVAKDLAAALKVNYGASGLVTTPDLTKWQIDRLTSPVKVSVENVEACPRYAGVVIEEIKVGPSPQWLVEKLQSIGVRPINNVVDTTNFVLHEMGQPLHAFDLDHITGREIRVKTLDEGTKFETLDTQIRTLSSGDLMICNGVDDGMCIAGVFGGINSGVTEGTTSIFLESAHFDAKWVRRTSTKHLLFTDAAKVFEKGSDPNICVIALKRAALLIKDLCGGRIASEIVDNYPHPVTSRRIELSYAHLNNLVGTIIKSDDVKEILTAMEMQIIESSEDSVAVLVPTNKTDVRREADLIEEVLRIYGYNKVPVPSKMNFTVHTTTHPDPSTIRNRVADYLASLGFHEMMAMSMVADKYVGEVLHYSEDQLVRINNTSHVHMDVMRPNLLISALETIQHNQYRQQENLRLFEFGKSYMKVEGEYVEQEHLAVTLAGWSSESWLTPQLASDKEFFLLKKAGEHILTLLGISGWKIESVDSRDFAMGIVYIIGKFEIATLGKVDSSLCEKMDIRDNVYYLDFHWEKLIQVTKVDQVSVKPLNRFPSVRRDIALVVDKGVKYIDIERVITKVTRPMLEELNLFDVYEDEKVLGKGKKSYALSITMRNATKTFSDNEIDAIMQEILKQIEKEVGGRLR